MIKDLYSLEFLLLGAILGAAVFIYTIRDYKIAVVLSFLSSFITSVFATNEPVWINEEVETGIGGYLRAAALFVSGLIGIIYYLRTLQIHKGKIPYQLVIFAIYIALILYSITYSIAHNHTISRAILFLSVFFMMIGLEKWLTNKERLDSLLLYLYYANGLVIVLCFLSLGFPHRSWWWQQPNRFIGLYPNPNAMGAFSMLAYPVLFWKFYEYSKTLFQKRFDLILIGMNALIHLFSGSRTTILTTIFGLSILFLIKRKIVKLVLFASILSIVGLVIIFIFTPDNLVRGEENASSTTVTGRDVLWGGAITMIMQRPYLGYGYLVEGKIWENQRLVTFTEEWIIPNAQQPLHNGYLSVIVGNGFIGFLFFLVSVIIPIVMLAKAKFEKIKAYKAYIISIFLMALITNMFESFLTGYHSPGDVLFWIMLIVSIKISHEDFFYKA